jgi:hypothetical protein
MTSHQKLQRPEQWNNIFNVLKQKEGQQRIPYPAKSHFRNKGEINTSPNMKYIREFATSIHALPEIIMKGRMKGH